MFALVFAVNQQRTVLEGRLEQLRTFEIADHPDRLTDTSVTRVFDVAQARPWPGRSHRDGLSNGRSGSTATTAGCRFGAGARRRRSRVGLKPGRRRQRRVGRHPAGGVPGGADRRGQPPGPDRIDRRRRSPRPPSKWTNSWGPATPLSTSREDSSAVRIARANFVVSPGIFICSPRYQKNRSLVPAQFGCCVECSLPDWNPCLLNNFGHGWYGI